LAEPQATATQFFRNGGLSLPASGWLLLRLSNTPLLAGKPPVAVWLRLTATIVI